ncbi:pseudouridine synthase [Lactobacillus hominis]|uniref:pseudouridine synthase n=1 Tax=Lactobacillus hominis TaxID=1203033 RepID=UPI0023F09C65|nr:pseudouridine synthase [Lactobacillus hominis]
MRIDKYLANMNVGSRKEVHKLIKAGMVSVNDAIIKTPKMQVQEDDNVMVGDQKISYQKYHYFLMNKPKGVLSATEDFHQKTVIDLLDKKDQYQNLAPVGRLDKDTTGLLIITNDGQFTHELLAPNKHVDKVYWAKIAGVADENTVNKFAEGLELGDGTQLKPAKLEILKQDIDRDSSEIEIAISEGKYHQIKRMFASLGMQVVELKRLSMGSLKLDDSLQRGQYRELTDEELAELKNKA